MALVGIHGHGRSHLGNAWRLHRQGVLRLTTLVDLAPLPDQLTLPPEDTELAPDELAALHAVPWTADLTEALAARPEVVVICTPIHTHAALTIQCLRAGADVLLEKPPTATLAEFEEVLEAERETGRVVQVGFQTFGSTTLGILHEIMSDGLIGEVTGIGAVGTWVRSLEYWSRSRWTGRRTLEGHDVVDGVTTNPLAHAVATGLHLAGARTAQDVELVELDQYRANDIEVDDTTAVRITTSGGMTVSLGLTLCAAESAAPLVTVHGTAGSAVLDYYADTVTVTRPEDWGAADRGVQDDHEVLPPRTRQGGRTTLLEDLIAHRATGSPLLSPLGGTGAFMRVLEAVRTAPDPRRIDPAYVTTVTDEAGTHLVVHDVAAWCARVAVEHRTFAELGAPWTRTAPSVSDPTGEHGTHDRAHPPTGTLATGAGP